MKDTMIHEWRRYRLKPGAAPAYLALLADEGLPLVTRHLPLMGYWLGETGPLNTLYHLWSYADWAEREACRASLATEEAWVKGFIPRAFALVEEQENHFLQLTAASPAFEAALRQRRLPRKARDVSQPLFSAQCSTLLSGATEGEAIATWQNLSGVSREALALMPRTADPVPQKPIAGSAHIILRPLAFSPL